MRGNLGGLGVMSGRMRSIPACAGEPGNSNTRVGVRAVYPRVCGGTFGMWILGAVVSGLSPRVRGNPLDALGERP